MIQGRRSPSKRTLVFLVITFFLSVGLLGCNQQNINRNINHWYPYQVVIDGVEINFKLPPDGRIFRKSPKVINTTELDSGNEYNSFAYVGYDYGSQWSDDISQFHFGFGLVRYHKPLKGTINVDELAVKVYEERQSQVIVESKLIEIGGDKWFYKYLRNVHGLEGESYTIPFNKTHYLSFGGGFGDKILNNGVWLKDRQKLLQEIVSTVVIKN